MDVEFSGGIAPNIDCSWSANNRWENVTSVTTNSTVLVELSTLATLSLKSQYKRSIMFWLVLSTEYNLLVQHSSQWT